MNTTENRIKFRHELEKAYTKLFDTDPRFKIAKSKYSPAQFSEKMMTTILRKDFSASGEGVRLACKACGIKNTYKAIYEYLEVK